MRIQASRRFDPKETAGAKTKIDSGVLFLATDWIGSSLRVTGSRPSGGSALG